MRKMLFILAPVISAVLCIGCSKKVHTESTPAVNKADYVTFTKALKYRLDHDKADVKKIQFYIDHPIVLRRTTGVEKGIIRSGTVTYDNGQTVTEMTIPAYTPGVCEKVVGDSLYISFDDPKNTILFGALYENELFGMLGSNWYNGVTDVNYDNQVYKAACGDCGSAADVKLMIRRYNAGAPKNQMAGGKMISGRTVK